MNELNPNKPRGLVKRLINKEEKTHMHDEGFIMHNNNKIKIT